jgi:hypothetical protein
MKYTNIDDIPLDPAIVKALYPPEPDSLRGLRSETGPHGFVRRGEVFHVT